VRYLIEPKRRNGDTVVHSPQLTQNSRYFRVIADGCGDEADLVSFRAPFECLCQNILGRNNTRRIVIVSGPAESTALRTAARDLNQEAVAHLCLGRPDSGRGAKNILIYKEI